MLENSRRPESKRGRHLALPEAPVEVRAEEEKSLGDLRLAQRQSEPPEELELEADFAALRLELAPEEQN